MRIGYAGAAGAFAHEACLAFTPELDAVAMAGFHDVVAAVREGQVDYGMLPLENVEAGVVPGMAELIEDLEVVSEQWLPIRMHLLGLPGVVMDDLTTAVSHPMALKQCAATIEWLGLNTEEASNTAVAAKSLADRHKAVLASEAAALAYGLTILRRDVHDHPDNATRFAMVAKRGRGAVAT